MKTGLPTDGGSRSAPAKIVHVFARFKTYSGAEHFCFRLAREARKRGDDVTIVTRHIPRELLEYLPQGVKIRTLSWSHKPTHFHFFESICDVLYSPFLTSLLPSDDTCAVFWNDNTLSCLSLDRLFRSRKRFFLCLQLPHFAYGQTWLVARSYPPLSWLVPVLAPVYRWLDRRLARQADRIIAISDMVRRDCTREYGRLDVALVHPGIDFPPPDLKDPTFVRERLNIRTRHILVTVGKLIPKKNFDLFIHVVRALRERDTDVSGVIVGDGPLRPDLERLIDSLDMQAYCRMTGFVREYEDVLRFMSGATIYVYLERNVPFGLTLLEAGSLGVPVVAFEGGGAEETIIDGESGCRIPSSWGAAQIADLLVDMLRGPNERLRRMGERGRDVAKRWTWIRAYDRFAEIVEAGRSERAFSQTRHSVESS